MQVLVSEIIRRTYKAYHKLESLEEKLPTVQRDQQRARIDLLKARTETRHWQSIAKELEAKLKEAELMSYGLEKNLEDQRNDYTKIERERAATQLRYELLKRELEVKGFSSHKDDGDAECPLADEICEELEACEVRLREEKARADSLLARLERYEVILSDDGTDEGGRKRQRGYDGAPYTNFWSVNI